MLNAPEIGRRLELPEGDAERLVVTPQPPVLALVRRGATSIDLRLGRWFRSFKQTQTNSVRLVGPPSTGLADPDHSRTKQHFVSFGEGFILHPGRFVLGVTLEWLRLPDDLSGYVTGKSSLGRHGLVIETAAGLHPRFSGCLTLELANVGEVPLEICPGMEICQVFLHKTDPSGVEEKGKFSGQRKPLLGRPSSDEIFQKLCGSTAAPPVSRGRGGSRAPR
jgi:dCTP deaminase